jgi:hypothetical protein
MRPAHDGQGYFRPICVEQRLASGALYDHHMYCGACRKRMGRMGEIKEHCPRCGKGIAHYEFTMGTEVYQASEWKDWLPDVWPVATVEPARENSHPTVIKVTEQEGPLITISDIVLWTSR